MTVCAEPPSNLLVGDRELSDLVRDLLASGYTPAPIPLPDWDIAFQRVHDRVVTVVWAAAYGDAQVTRWEALYDPAYPLVHLGRRLEFWQAPPIEALRRLLAEDTPAVHPPVRGVLDAGQLTLPAWGDDR